MIMLVFIVDDFVGDVHALLATFIESSGVGGGGLLVILNV
jgi:hypothetical protein